MNRSHAVMTVLFIVLGVALGARMLEGEGGFIFGGLVGFLLADVIELRRRLARSERQPTEGGVTPDAVAPTPPFEPAREKPPAPAPAAAAPDLVVPSPRSEPPVPPTASPIEPEPAHSLESPTARPSAPSDAEVVRVAPLAHQGPSFDGGGIRLIRTWVTTGNVPVKIGVLLSLIGLGFLLGVALDQGWITLSIEVRHVLVAMFGVFMLAVGWRVRRRNPIYGLSLQGGGIAVLYLTTYVAHAVYDLLPASASAAAVVMITVGAGALAVLEDARSLAVLGIIGGFLAPILAYSDASDHVLVFGFYLILSAAVVAVARFKTWPELNLLGLGFTLGVSAFWILNRYSEQDWATTQPLIALLVLLYMTIPVLFAARQPPDLKAWMTSPLVFGLPFAALGLQLGPHRTLRVRGSGQFRGPSRDPGAARVDGSPVRQGVRIAPRCLRGSLGRLCGDHRAARTRSPIHFCGVGAAGWSPRLVRRPAPASSRHPRGQSPAGHGRARLPRLPHRVRL